MKALITSCFSLESCLERGNDFAFVEFVSSIFFNTLKMLCWRNGKPVLGDDAPGFGNHEFNEAGHGRDQLFDIDQACFFRRPQELQRILIMDAESGRAELGECSKAPPAFVAVAT